MIEYAVYWNTGEACGGIEQVDMNKIWTSDNQCGWTYNHIGGPFDNCHGIYKTHNEAIDILNQLKAKTHPREIIRRESDYEEKKINMAIRKEIRGILTEIGKKTNKISGMDAEILLGDLTFINNQIDGEKV